MNFSSCLFCFFALLFHLIVQIFRLEPKVGSDKEPESMEVEEFNSEQKADRVRELTNLYGTKKSINQVILFYSSQQDFGYNGILR